MSYLVLARKSRPQTFTEVVGQKAVVKTLQNSIARDRIAHAILFSGVRGVGKTTIARIMAKAINCQAKEGEKPCNLCQPCRDIAAGRFLDLTEIDGASNRGIQEIRELKENLKFMPAHSAYKVIIIDEVHMLTTEAFNALLKTLEEPPAHVYFMFATTEIHKIPVTILSRCQQFELKKIPAEELAAHFQKLADAENVEIEPAALSLIVREAAGSIRDGLSLLDQMFSFGEKRIIEEDVVEVLGLISRKAVMQLAVALLDGERVQVFSCLDTVFAHGANHKRFMQDLLEIFRNLLLCSIRGGSDLIDATTEELTELQRVAAKTTAETLHLKLSLLMEAAENLQYAPQPKLALEISFLKIIEAGNVTPLATLLGQLGKILPQMKELEEIQADTVAAAPQITVEDPVARILPPQPPIRPVEESAAPPKKSEIPTTSPSSSSPCPVADSTEEDEKIEEEVPAEDENDPSPLSETEMQKRWPDFLTFLEQDTIWLAAAASNAEEQQFVSENGETTLHLHFSDRKDAILLAQPEKLQQLTSLALDFFAKKLTIKLHHPEKGEEIDENSPRMRRNALASNPLVQMAEDIFRGKVAAVRLADRQERGK